MVPTRAKFKEVAEKCGGNVSAIAVAFGKSRTAIRKWIAQKPEFALIVEDARDSLVDLAESQMMKLIQGIPIKDDKGNVYAWQERPDSNLIKFMLATRGKKRGYTESLAVSGPNDGPIRHSHNVDVSKLSDEQLLDIITGASGPA